MQEMSLNVLVQNVAKLELILSIQLASNHRNRNRFGRSIS